MREIEAATVDIDGLDIHFRRCGDGPPIALLHGGLVDGRVWRPQLEALSDEFTVVAWDAPGCGLSADPPEDFGLAGYADCFAQFARALGLEHPHVLGLSFGGGLALEVYRRHPALPSSLILASAYAGWAGSLPPEVVEQRRQEGLQGSRRPPGEVVERWLPTLFSDSVAPQVVQEVAGVMMELRPTGMRAMLEAFADADLRDVLGCITVPTLLLYGEVDQRSPLEVARELHARIPGSHLSILPGVGHVTNLEAPDAFNAEVRTFLHAVPPPPP